MKVRIYIEGAPHGVSNQTVARFREAFHSFLGKVLDDLPSPKVIPCGSRDQTYKQFSHCAATNPDAFGMILVDSEDPVAEGKTASAHLADREKHWSPIPDGQAHLMVQCMEAWFLADKNALSAYYGAEFKAQALRQNPNIEGIAKKDVLGSLEAATRAATRKGKYDKTKHGFDILGNIGPNKVANASPFAKDLINVLRERLAQ